MAMQNCNNAYNVCGWRAVQIDPCTGDPILGPNAQWATSRIKEWNATKEFNEGEVLTEQDGCSSQACVEIREPDCAIRWSGTALYCGTADHEFQNWIQGGNGSLFTQAGFTVGSQDTTECNEAYFWVEVFERLDYGRDCDPLLPTHRKHIWPKVIFKLEEYNMVRGVRNLALTWRAERYNASAAGYTGPWGDIPAAFNIFDPTPGLDYLHAQYDTSVVPVGQSCGLQTL